MNYLSKSSIKGFIFMSMVLFSQRALPSFWDWFKNSSFKPRIYLNHFGGSIFVSNNKNDISYLVIKGPVTIMEGGNYYSINSMHINNKNVNDFPVVKGSGNVVEQQRGITSFNAISSIFPVHVIHSADQNTVTLKGEDTILDALKIKVKNNELIITSKNKEGVCLEPTTYPPVQLTVGLNNKEKLSLSGAGTYDLGTVKADSFNLKVSGSSTVIQLQEQMKMQVSGSSNVAMNIIARTLGLDLSGASKVTVSGKVDKQNVDISGASHYKAEQLESSIATIDASGASKLQLYVKEKLNGLASGVAKVIYYGNPNSVQVKKSGGAQVYKG